MTTETEKSAPTDGWYTNWYLPIAYLLLIPSFAGVLGTQATGSFAVGLLSTIGTFVLGRIVIFLEEIRGRLK